MLGYVDLSGSDPCPDCDSDSGDCDWLGAAGRCSPQCTACHGENVGRCGYCGEVVPCGMEAGRNPRQDALCAWRSLARLHGPDCPWTKTRGSDLAPLPTDVARIVRG